MYENSGGKLAAVEWKSMWLSEDERGLERLTALLVLPFQFICLFLACK